MSEDSLWDLFFTPWDVRVAREARDAAAGAAAQMHASQMAASYAMDGLRRNDADLLRQVRILQAMVSALGGALIQAKVVDSEVVRQQFEGTLREMFPPPPPPPPPRTSSSAYRGPIPTPVPKRDPPPPPEVACDACGAKVPLNTTFVTETGTVCAACYEKRPAK